MALKDKLPLSLRRRLNHLAFDLGAFPRVKPCDIPHKLRFPDNRQGGFVMSADFEMGWAFRFSKTRPDAEKNSAPTRKGFSRLVELFEETGVPITWATVGHLFLEECKPGDHDWMHRIPYFDHKTVRFMEGDWFECDPHSHWSDANIWYAPDLIKQIMQSSVPHEIGCHTFSHMNFDDRYCPPEVADDEIKACLQAAEPYNIQQCSMVFPCGTYGNIPVLKRYGFTVYRRNIDYKLAYPFLDEHGLMVIPSTSGVDFGKKASGWSVEQIQRRLLALVDRAISTHTVGHFWFHPSMVEEEREILLAPLLRHVAQRRNEGRLWVGTMGEADRLAREAIERAKPV